MKRHKLGNWSRHKVKLFSVKCTNNIIKLLFIRNYYLLSLVFVFTLSNKYFKIIRTSITDVLHSIHMTTKRTTLLHQFVFVKGSFVMTYYLLKLLQSNLDEQL